MIMASFGLYGGLLSVGVLLFLVGRTARLLSFPWEVRSSEVLIQRAERGDFKAFQELIQRDLEGKKGVFCVAEDSWHYTNPPKPGDERTKFVSFPSRAFVQRYETAIGQEEEAAKERVDRYGISSEERCILARRLKQLDRLHRDVRKFKCRANFLHP